MFDFSPAICKDNFFDDPYQIKEITKNILFKKSNYISGYRSENIANIDQNLYEYINKKIVKTYFAGLKDVTFSAESFFQKSEPDINDGWVHQDTGNLTAIIYLTIGETSGTSIYNLKTEYLSPDWNVGTEQKHNYFGNKENFTHEQKNEIQQKKLKNNSFFDKTISFRGKFNRMICFDSRQYHASEICDKERLVIVSFIDNLRNSVIK